MLQSLRNAHAEKGQWKIPNFLNLNRKKAVFFQTTSLIFVGLTHEIPFSIGDIAADICLLHLQVQGPPSIRPGSKLQFALLHVKGEPAHINVAGALEYACVGDGNNHKAELEDN